MEEAGERYTVARGQSRKRSPAELEPARIWSRTGFGELGQSYGRRDGRAHYGGAWNHELRQRANVLGISAWRGNKSPFLHGPADEPHVEDHEDRPATRSHEHVLDQNHSRLPS